ncbi:MAG: hypothetical protein JSC188_000819 [Candidatus Tokpelaia sp. JSC188]|nr:MAG: hypothetical protein JSC188_000819 [Candidatus Tokpelaia sp. JSC188]
MHKSILAKIIAYFSHKRSFEEAFFYMKEKATVVIEESLPKIDRNILNKVFLILISVLAIFCLFMGAFYWVRLIGVFPGPLWRFDLMPWNWRILCSSLSVLYPMASNGIWMGSRWGITLWFCASSTETVCMTLYSNYFSWNLWISLLHISCFVCYGFFSMMLFFKKSERVQVAIEY